MRTLIHAKTHSLARLCLCLLAVSVFLYAFSGCGGTGIHWPSWTGLGSATSAASDAVSTAGRKHRAGPPGLSEDLNKFLDPIIWACILGGSAGALLSIWIEIIPRKVCGGAVAIAFALILGKSFLVQYAEAFFIAFAVCIVAACAPWVIAAFRAFEHRTLSPSKKESSIGNPPESRGSGSGGLPVPPSAGGNTDRPSPNV